MRPLTDSRPSPRVPPASIASPATSLLTARGQRHRAGKHAQRTVARQHAQGIQQARQIGIFEIALEIDVGRAERIGDRARQRQHRIERRHRAVDGDQFEIALELAIDRQGAGERRRQIAQRRHHRGHRRQIRGVEMQRPVDAWRLAEIIELAGDLGAGAGDILNPRLAQAQRPRLQQAIELQALDRNLVPGQRIPRAARNRRRIRRARRAATAPPRRPGCPRRARRPAAGVVPGTTMPMVARSA